MKVSTSGLERILCLPRIPCNPPGNRKERYQKNQCANLVAEASGLVVCGNILDDQEKTDEQDCSRHDVSPYSYSWLHQKKLSNWVV
jgi:hypothetical protein